MKPSKEEIKKAIAYHKRWFDTGGKEGRLLNFLGAELEGADFSGADLTNAIFSGADLTNAIFSGAKLEGAVFDSAVLKNADFHEANLANCSFKEAELDGTNFELAKMGGASFECSKIFNSNFSFTFSVGVDFRMAVISDCMWTGANLLNARLSARALGDDDYEVFKAVSLVDLATARSCWHTALKEAERRREADS